MEVSELFPAGFQAMLEMEEALAESMTLLADTHVPDEVFSTATAVFIKEEVAVVTMAIVVINAWNRIVGTSRTAVG